jgi:hypothetical protein
LHVIAGKEAATSVIGVTQHGVFATEVCSIAASVPQLGQNMFMILTKPRPETQPSRFLGFMEEATCTNVNCNAKQWKPTDVTDGRYNELGCILFLQGGIKGELDQLCGLYGGGID